MIEPRIYRAAFVPALLALVLVAFSLESRSRPLPQGLAADVLFDGGEAAAEARRIATEHPDRAPGSAGNLAVAGEVERAFEESGFTVVEQRFRRDGAELRNVVARRAGRSRRQVVVVAPRDAAVVPDAAGSASDTATLIELARVYEGRPSLKTIVLASVDGSTLGDVGASELVDELGDKELVDAVVAVSSTGFPGDVPPAVVTWGNDTARASVSLQRTVADSLRLELERPAPSPSPAGQLARLAFPLGLGSQGVLLARGYDAVRVAGDGKTVPEAPADGGSEVDAERLDGLGRATLRAVTAVDQGPPRSESPRPYLLLAGQTMPGWVLAVFAAMLILPVLVTAVDALARVRRRGGAVLPWIAWVAAGALPFLIALGLAHLLVLTGAIPDAPPAPAPPGLYPLDLSAALVLGAVAVTIALGWIGMRRLAESVDPIVRDPTAPAAGVAVTLVLALAAVALWLVDPFAALVAVPAVHLWMLAMLADPAPSLRTGLLLIGLGLLLPALLAIYQLFLLGVDPLGGAWYLLLLTTGGQVGPIAVCVAAAFAAAFGSALAIVVKRARKAVPPIAQASTRGPLSYAGPGSLGGTDSALRR